MQIRTANVMMEMILRIVVPPGDPRAVRLVHQGPALFRKALRRAMYPDDVPRETSGPVPVCIMGVNRWATDTFDGILEQHASYYPAACCPVRRAKWEDRWGQSWRGCGLYHSDGTDGALSIREYRDADVSRGTSLTRSAPSRLVHHNPEG